MSIFLGTCRVKELLGHSEGTSFMGCRVDLSGKVVSMQVAKRLCQICAVCCKHGAVTVITFVWVAVCSREVVLNWGLFLPQGGQLAKSGDIFVYN